MLTTKRIITKKILQLVKIMSYIKMQILCSEIGALSTLTFTLLRATCVLPYILDVRSEAAAAADADDPALPTTLPLLLCPPWLPADT